MLYVIAWCLATCMWYVLSVHIVFLKPLEYFGYAMSFAPSPFPLSYEPLQTPCRCPSVSQSPAAPTRTQSLPSTVVSSICPHDHGPKADGGGGDGGGGAASARQREGWIFGRGGTRLDESFREMQVEWKRQAGIGRG